MIHIDKRHIDLLNDIAGTFIKELTISIWSRSTEELSELVIACNAATPTNCPWYTYYAAKMIRDEIEMRSRHIASISERAGHHANA